MAVLRTLTLLCVAACASASPGFSGDLAVRQVNSALPAALCNPCIQFTEQGLNILINEILNAGVIGGCSKLCGGIKSKNAARACDLVCGVIGIKTFIKALNSTDLDPIYFCEKITACPKAQPSASASITSVVAAPLAGPQGTKFDLDINFDVVNATSTGEIRIAVVGPVTTQISSSFVQMGFAPGNFNAKITLDTTTVEPTDQDPGVTWNNGAYQYTFELCQGECGSKHPGSIVFGHKSGNFTVTDSPGPAPGPSPGPSPGSAPAGKTHYGDPSKGCLSDEQAVQITGLKGDFCAPDCASAACPTDVPAGVAAKPQCALKGSTGTDKKCALICSPAGKIDEASLRAGDAACGTGASCKAIQSTGICTYDDAPSV